MTSWELALVCALFAALLAVPVGALVVWFVRRRRRRRDPWRRY